MYIAPHPLKKFEELSETVLADKQLLTGLLGLKEKIEICKAMLEGSTQNLDKDSVWVDIAVHGRTIDDEGKTQDMINQHMAFNFDRAEEKTVPLKDTYRDALLSLTSTVLDDTDTEIQDLIKKYDELVKVANSLLNKQKE